MTRARKTKGLKKLISEPFNFLELAQFLGAVRKYDDRAAAIVAGAQLENALEFTLIKRLPKLDKADFGSLFHPDRPLSSFAAKIYLGHALGIYGENTRQDLNQIREIRNVFAHARRAVTFKTEEVAKHCSKLTLPVRGVNAVPTFAAAFWPPPQTNTRSQYLESAMFLWEGLMDVAAGNEPKCPLD